MMNAAEKIQPTFTDCANCGTCDHNGYACPCACHPEKGQQLQIVLAPEDLHLVPVDSIPGFAFGHRALFTVVSKTTGQRFTFKIKAPKEGKDAKVRFVSVLVGSNNESDYAYLGTIFNGKDYVHGAKSKISNKAPSAKAFSWFWACVQANKFTSIDVYHHGRCGRCGKTLTVPESVISGLGPECAKLV